MSIDFLPRGAEPPRNGDFARYVEDLVNRGQAAPGAVPTHAAAPLPAAVRSAGKAGHAPANVVTGPAHMGARLKQLMTQLESGARSTPMPAGPSAGAHSWGARPAGGTSPAEASPAGASPTGHATANNGAPPDLQLVLGSWFHIARRLLLPVGVAWLVLGLAADIPFFADSLPFGMFLLFASFFLRPAAPAKKP